MEDLEKKIKKDISAYEKKYVSGSSREHKKSWRSVKKDLTEILEAAKAPYIARKIELPLILIATPEIVSLPPNMGNAAHIVKTGEGGGLADISAALVAELDRQGVNVHVAVPEYQELFETEGHLRLGEYEKLRTQIDETTRIHLISDDIFTGATRVYSDMHTGLDKIDLRKANAFQRGIISRTFKTLRRQYENILVHCNDWMTGLLPAAAKSRGIRSLMTFHNIFTQYQWPKGLQKHSIDIRPFWQFLYFKSHPDTYGPFEANYELNEVDFMTSGLFAADYINTVSPTFLIEIVEGYFREHGIIPDSMRHVIRDRYLRGSAAGILNAPMVSADPRIDPFLKQKFWYEETGGSEIADLLEGKMMNREYFLKQMGLEPNFDTPLFFWPSRIARPQKGFELLLKLIPQLMTDYKMQIAVVSTGDSELIAKLKEFQKEFPGKISYKAFSRDLNQIGKAAADFILMPSLYEPCGIPQVEGPRYGTFPIVRRTGGLADTVEHLSSDGSSGNGFVFEHFTPEGLLYGIREAMTFYSKDAQFRASVQRRIMEESFKKFNITNTAKRYIEVYQQIFSRYDPSLKVV